MDQYHRKLKRRKTSSDTMDSKEARVYHGQVPAAHAEEEEDGYKSAARTEAFGFGRKASLNEGASTDVQPLRERVKQRVQAALGFGGGGGGGGEGAVVEELATAIEEAANCLYSPVHQAKRHVPFKSRTQQNAVNGADMPLARVLYVVLSF